MRGVRDTTTILGLLLLDFASTLPWSYFANQLLPVSGAIISRSAKGTTAGGNDDGEGKSGGDDDDGVAAANSFRICAWLRTAGNCLSKKPTSSPLIGRLDTGSEEVLTFPQRLADIPLGSVVVRAFVAALVVLLFPLIV